jgi:hypothetical protein
MQALEFTAQLDGGNTVSIPEEVAAQLPKTGRARVIIVTADDPDETEWRKGACEQFAREDAPEDAVYDSYQ